jgi:hypothetical protein
MSSNRDIIAIVTILRKTTRIVKVYPFIYAMLYVMCMFGYMLFSENVAIILDQLFYTSPIVVSCNIALSYALKLCKWHRMECSLPLIPMLPLFADYYIYPLNNIAVGINTTIMIILCLASLINAYFVFIKPHNPR